MKILSIALSAIWVAWTTAVSAGEFSKGDIHISNPWTRATLNGVMVGAGYLQITNTGKEADTLTGGTFDGADTVVHEMKMEDHNLMIMRQLVNGLVIKPGDTAEFAPGSTHLMFIGLKRPIVEGPNVKGFLNFQKAGVIEIEYKVVAETKSADRR